MAENEFLDKWIVYQPSDGSNRYLNKVKVVYCFKETKKQLKCVENKNITEVMFSCTVAKNSVICIVPEEKVKDIRDYAMHVNNDYNREDKELFYSFQKMMLNFPR